MLSFFIASKTDLIASLNRDFVYQAQKTTYPSRDFEYQTCETPCQLKNIAYPNGDFKY